MLDNLLDRLFFFYKREHFLDDELKSTYKRNLTSLKKTLGFSFHNKSYFIKAITHSSFLELHPELLKSNERLEFLGDAVLNLIVAKYLFNNYTDEEEGFLTKSRSSLVNRESLFNTAEELGLQNIILYNQKYLGESVEGLQTILADCMEAVIGAVYLDRGLKKVEKFIIERIVKPLENDERFLIDTNYKGQLLEYTHARKMLPPRYVVTSEVGPPHKKEFTIDVYVGEKLLGTGYGKSKKSAEQQASKTALDKFSAGN